MKHYKYCFLGIPLPNQFRDNFENLLHDLKKIDANLTTIETKTLEPHLTVYYLDKQSEKTLSEVAKIADASKSTLKGSVLEIGGMGYFKEGNPFVMFLGIKYPPQLSAFYKEMAMNLSGFFSQDQEFHPHITVARMNDKETQTSFKKNESLLRSLMDQIKWEFPIKELVIYGYDPNNSSGATQRLHTISID